MLLILKEVFFDTAKSSKNASNKENGLKDRTFCSEMSQEQYYSDTKRGLLSMIDIADRLRTYLVVYHPRALIEYLYSGIMLLADNCTNLYAS